MSSVELRKISKSFGAVKIIHEIDLSIAEGEFVALVGPSGCGKSTLLRIISGLEPMTGGTVFINDRVVNDESPRERNIAMVFQSYALYPHMSVAENMGFNLKLSRVPKEEIRQQVREAAHMLDLENLLDRKPAQLSGGQRQRVAMGRAIVRKPAVFLFDEPLSNLDAKLRVQMRSEIKTLHQKMPTTSIYVTHDQIEAMTLADRVVVLNHGRIEQAGTPIELYRSPANLFVAGFIGSPAMNFVDAVATITSEGPVAMLSQGLVIALMPQTRVTHGQQVVLGLRPEHLVPTGTGSILTGPTLLVEPTGAQTHVQFEFAGRNLTAVVDGAQEVRTGERFEVSILSEMVHVFDRESGARLNAPA